MNVDSLISSSLFSNLTIEFFLFCLTPFILLFILRYHIRHKTAHLGAYLYPLQTTFGKLIRKYTRIAVMAIVLVCIAEWLILNLAIKTEQNRLMLFVTKFSSSYTLNLESSGHYQMRTDMAMDDPVYLKLIGDLKGWMDANDLVISMYTMRQDAKGEIRFILAPETDYNGDGIISGELEARVPIGEIYDEPISELKEAFSGKETFQRHVSEDKWGESISIFLPLFTSDHRVDAVLGIDFDPMQLLKNIQPIQYATLAFGGFAVLLILGGYYLMTMREIAKMQTGYFVEKLNHHQHMLEEQVEEEVHKRQEKERILAHQARLAAMGEMISNITHQWRQPLTAISNIVQEMQDAFKYNELDAQSMAENTKSIKTQISLMSNTIDDFRNFFSPSKIVSSFYAKDQIKTTLMLLQGMLQKNNIIVDLYIDGDVEIKGYANEYNHVLINLFNNARDIFNERAVESPRITIRIDEAEGHSIVTFSDNGGGVPEKYLDTIFEPYFTTKDEKHGTGIGLYMCKQIIESNMNGHLSVTNDEDGAVFTITI